MTTSPTILTIEDEAAIRRGIVDALSYAGYRVLEADNGNDGLELALNASCELVLLDLMLPQRNGLDILREVRERHPTLPVIVLTARGAEDDRVAGLKLGADDYVVKPFSVKELTAARPSVPIMSAQRMYLAASPISTAAKCASRTASVTNCRNARRSCCGTWCLIVSEPSRGTSS